MLIGCLIERDNMLPIPENMNFKVNPSEDEFNTISGKEDEQLLASGEWKNEPDDSELERPSIPVRFKK